MPKPDKTADAAQAISEAMAQFQKLGMSSMNRMGAEWMEQMSDMGSEVLSFVADRVRKDVELQHKIMHCTDPAELHRIQAEFWQEAIEQYSAETGKLVEMGTKPFSAKSDSQG
ncbi:phasin family protein [Primorskyibacter sp. S87]|uniref:phasin family protein n=1 Tax=Primorskyibacter sp. S87 TaxID=3415126 RepID=UPI003C7DEB4E